MQNRTLTLLSLLTLTGSISACSQTEFRGNTPSQSKEIPTEAKGADKIVVSGVANTGTNSNANADPKASLTLDCSHKNLSWSATTPIDAIAIPQNCTGASDGKEAGNRKIDNIVLFESSVPMSSFAVSAKVALGKALRNLADKGNDLNLGGIAFSYKVLVSLALGKGLDENLAIITGDQGPWAPTDRRVIRGDVATDWVDNSYPGAGFDAVNAALAALDASPNNADKHLIYIGAVPAKSGDNYAVWTEAKALSDFKAKQKAKGNDFYLSIIANATRERTIAQDAPSAAMQGAQLAAGAGMPAIVMEMPNDLELAPQKIEAYLKQTAAAENCFLTKISLMTKEGKPIFETILNDKNGSGFYTAKPESGKMQAPLSIIVTRSCESSGEQKSTFEVGL